MQILYVGIIGLDNKWNEICFHSNSETERKISYKDSDMGDAAKIQKAKGTF